MKPPCPGQAWKDVYAAALFENDRAEVGLRIAAAEAEIAKRKSVLEVGASETAAERGELAVAQHMLQALKRCLQIETTTTMAATVWPASTSESRPELTPGKQFED